MAFASAGDIGLINLKLETGVSQGVCSHVRRLKKASDVGRQKEKLVEVRKFFALCATAAMLGMSRSWMEGLDSVSGWKKVVGEGVVVNSVAFVSVVESISEEPPLLAKEVWLLAEVVIDDISMKCCGWSVLRVEGMR